jgi:hypothetical protein
MVSTLETFTGIQKIPNIKAFANITHNFVGAGNFTTDLYTCPAGKKALFDPLNWNVVQITGNGQVILQIFDGVSIFPIDLYATPETTFGKNRIVNKVLLAAGDKLQFFMSNTAGGSTNQAVITSAPLELPA